MEKPTSLEKGDKVMIVSTARKVSREEMAPAIEVLEGWGLVVTEGDNLYGDADQFSGTTTERIEDLQKALDDESIKAVFCARGGYGTIKIIDGLDFEKFKSSPKWIVGFSDVTVLHNHINKNFGIQTMHAIMPINFETTEVESLDSLQKALFGESLSYEIDHHELNRKGSGEGVLVGGNLSIIYSLTGTNSQIDTSGKILFIEDLDEYIYHIDRMMMNLKRTGMLENLSGLIIGGMSDMNDNAIPYGKTAEQIISETVAAYNYPVCFGFDAGHTKKNLALIMGGSVSLVVEDNCRLSFN